MPTPTTNAVDQNFDDWPMLEAALERNSIEDVAGWLAGAAEARRLAVFTHLVGYVRRNREQPSWWHPRKPAVLALAGLGCAPDARRATAAVFAHGAWRDGTYALAPEVAIAVLRERAVTWLPELAAGVAAGLDARPWDEWRLADALVREAGLPVPAEPSFAIGWWRHVHRGEEPHLALAADPHRPVLLPLVLQHEQFGEELARGSARIEDTLRRLAAADPAAAAVVRSGCRVRLLLGGSPGAVRPFTRLHDAIPAEAGDLAAGLTDYLSLLHSAHSTVVGLAQRALCAADEAGLLELDTLRDITVTMLARDEKKLRQAQQVWLRAAARRRPAHRAELLALLDPPAIATEPPQPAPAPQSAALQRLTTIAELAEEVAALLHGDLTPVTLERVMAGLVTVAATDRPAAARTLGPVVARRRDWLNPGWDMDQTLIWCALAVMGGSPGLADEAKPVVADVHRRMQAGGPLAPLHPHGNLTPTWLLQHRLAELSVHGPVTPVPVLLATPTEVNGHLDPAELAARLARYEQAGHEPWPADLAQALLRLPRAADPATATAAGRLRSPAGIALAQRLRDGHPDPVTTRLVQAPGLWGTGPAARGVVSLTPPADAGPIERRLFTLTPPQRVGHQPAGDPATWVAMLPSHREVVAAWSLPNIAAGADSGAGGGVRLLLPMLAEISGPIGPAVTLAVAYALAAGHAVSRAAAVDALIGFDAALDRAAVGREFGWLGAAGLVKVKRAAATLNDAARAGAVAGVWELCRAALPELLRAESPQPGVADVVEVACRCAVSLGVRGSIAMVDGTAARGGSSRVVVEARKLAAALAR
ncbi:DUF7824 domain-containing protein [Catellatospora citrea]|uniref:DUF7824 domain-containing protein n=1 Tax=Catellatospora citrea TaxID=53366 RepID=A0A8J3KSF0_9ACTN|nr:DUF6493 family protein [Catellatospora citrea]RKE12004.1 hypothetical protein C8E86_6938 [Catellatospora citrea]GIG00435.1 hypothetical protein Cci01nite_55280 [Catellatospora citrea]